MLHVATNLGAHIFWNASDLQKFAQLGKLAQQDEQDAAIRREWSVEMRSQLQGLRELCETAVAEQKAAAAAAAASGRGPTIISSQVSQQSAVAGQLLSDLARSLASQSARLAGAADSLERDLRAHAASILAPDEPEEVAVSDYVKHGCEDIAAPKTSRYRCVLLLSFFCLGVAVVDHIIYSRIKSHSIAHSCCCWFKQTIL